jgi:adenine-specific DNA-methyltransferase
MQLLELYKIVLIKLKDNINPTKEKLKMDYLVYKLYELTYDEVLVVEPEFSLSKQEYEAFTV